MKDRFAKRLQEVRQEAGASQKELAARIGISESSLFKYEAGEVLPSLKTAAQISNALDVSLDYLAGGFADSEEENRKNINLFFEVKGR